MSAILTFLASIFSPLIQSVGGRLSTAYTTSINTLETGEKIDLHDATAKFVADRAAGKGYGEAAADALSLFFNESKGTVGSASHLFFQAFLKSPAAQ